MVMLLTTHQVLTVINERTHCWSLQQVCVLLVCSSRTAMIATVAMAGSQYHHTVNTLKYADRAKEIKTHVRRNQGSVAMHVAQMRQAIVQLQQQNSVLKAMLTAPLVRASSSALLLPKDGAADALGHHQEALVSHAHDLQAANFSEGLSGCTHAGHTVGEGLQRWTADVCVCVWGWRAAAEAAGAGWPAQCFHWDHGIAPHEEGVRAGHPLCPWAGAAGGLPAAVGGPHAHRPGARPAPLH